MSPTDQAEALYHEVLSILGRYQLEFDLADDTLAGVLGRAQFDLNAGSVVFEFDDDYGDVEFT
jgi:hypothetical protein